MPLRIEAVLPDPRAGSDKSVAFGYDASASAAPANVSLGVALVPGSTNATLQVSTLAPGSRLALVGEIFERDAAGARVRSTGVRLDQAPVPRSTTIAVAVGDDPETDPTSVALDVSGRTDLTATVTDTVASPARTIAADLEGLEGTLRVEATGTRRVGYAASTRLSRIGIDVVATLPGRARPVQSLAAQLVGVPRTMDVTLAPGTPTDPTRFTYEASDVADLVTARVEQGDDATAEKRVVLDARVDRIPMRLAATLDPPNDTGEPVRVALEASSPTERVTVSTNGGDRESLDLSVGPIPTELTVCATQERSGCARPTRGMGGNAGSLSVTASAPLRLELRECITAGCGERRVVDITLSRLEFQADLSGRTIDALRGAAWFDTDDRPLTGTLTVRGEQDLDARFPAGFPAQDRQLFWPTNPLDGELIERYGSATCPNGIRLDVVRPVITYHLAGVAFCGRELASILTGAT